MNLFYSGLNLEFPNLALISQHFFSSSSSSIFLRILTASMLKKWVKYLWHLYEILDLNNYNLILGNCKIFSYLF